MAGERRWHLLPQILEQRRLELVLLLGGICKVCGSDFDLEIHHRFGKNWRSRDYSRSMRLKKYKQDILNGECFLLCKWCHDTPEEHPSECFCPKCCGETVSDF